ncbi:tetratricopeptide repeat protein [Cyanobium sp. Morenito 9A2]|uniref:O-linked N-acetylglucosamine transferase, SPINDLY family protein n=1 Tax=Cyanobium sp. Morenito 9A2 TaxID=2823718 RepID=UPI0020CBCC5F|nr:tetratricopeptide repeat protein [Cyanobium sp. Morenito 9A2]MCP9849482.1 tetratricopeptide repeat protein [Cyanobium sp. Morenito 9A2]
MAPTEDPTALRARFREARELERAGDGVAAERAYRELLELTPGHGPALLQLANVRQRLGDPHGALALLDQLLASQPTNARAHCNRGVLLQLRGDLDGASSAYQRALGIDRTIQVAADNLVVLANLLNRRQRHDEAVEVLRCRLRLGRHDPDVLLNLGGLLLFLGRFEAARRCYERLILRQPEHRQALSGLGQALEALGEPEAAIEAHQRALALDPDATAEVLLLEHLRLCLCDWNDYPMRMAHLRERLDSHGDRVGVALLSPLRLLCFPLPPSLQLRLARQWSSQYSAAMASRNLSPPPARMGLQRIRVGYLSADFRNHAMGNLIHGLFAHHDRSRFEVYAYALADLDDAYTHSVRRGADHFITLASGDTEAIAERIRADGLDVLIDLMGHTHHGRPAALALRPAPVQLLYLGFPGSMGADFIDGVIADHWLIPPGREHGYVERVLRLPWGFVSSPPPPGAEDATMHAPDEPARAPAPLTRRSCGLPERGVVYACFNRAEKIDPPSFDRWLDILRGAPGSVLWLALEHPRARGRLLQRAEAAGVDPTRLVFTAKVATADFATLCGLADLFLDTGLYGAGATGVAALQAGLPLLTCPGDTFASRMGASLCAAVGLEELIAPTPDTYKEMAIALGQRPAELARLRRHLLDPRVPLPLFDTAAWVGHLETLLLQVVGEQGQATDAAPS